MTATHRWLFFLFSILAGIGLGLLYGWVISPVEYVDTAPDSLRADFRVDYVLMVAETYQSEQDPSLAARRLGLLGTRPPYEIALEAFNYAQGHQYPTEDVLLLQNLTLAMQPLQPAGGPP